MEKYVECHNCQKQYDCERTYLGGCTDGKAWEQEEKKLTAEVVVKALEHCSHNRSCEYCYHNDERGSGEIVCRSRLMGKSLDLIHRLQKENEELKSPKFASWKLKFFNLKDELKKELAEHEEFTKKAKAEIERLAREVDKQKNFVTAWEESWKIANEQNTKIRVKLKKENAELQKQVDKAWFEVGKMCMEERKDTAREICDLILEHWEKKQFVECDWLRVAIAEKYGVEVE